jgi:hypothetical protein
LGWEIGLSFRISTTGWLWQPVSACENVRIAYG